MLCPLFDQFNGFHRPKDAHLFAAFSSKKEKFSSRSYLSSYLRLVSVAGNLLFKSNCNGTFDSTQGHEKGASKPEISPPMAFLGTYYNKNIDSESENDDDPAQYDSHDDIAGANGYLLPSLEAIFHHPPPPTIDPNSPSHEEFFHGSIFSPYGNEAGDSTGRTQNENGPTLTEEAYEGQQQLYTGSGNWLREHDFCSSGFWRDLFPHGHGTFDSGYDSGLEKTEVSGQSEEQYDSYCEDMDEQPAYGYNPWSGWGSGSGYREEDDSCEYGRQEPNTIYSGGYSQYGLGLCEAVFGYWPCLYQKDQKSSAEDGENKQSYGYMWNGSPFVQ